MTEELAAALQKYTEENTKLLARQVELLGRIVSTIETAGEIIKSFDDRISVLEQKGNPQ